MPFKTLTSAIMPLLAAAISFSQARAQNADAMAGTYCLVGVMEVGSCIRLSAGGRFEYFLAYGAYDEKSEGAWKWQDGEVVLDSPAYNRRPAFAFKRMQPGDAGAFDIIVENKSGRSLAGIDVDVTCDGTTTHAGVTQEAEFKVGCTSVRRLSLWVCGCSTLRRKKSTSRIGPAPEMSTSSNSIPAIWAASRSLGTACGLTAATLSP